MTSGISKLSLAQRHLLDAWLPGATVTRDHSWGLVGTVVLELLHEGAKYVVKAGDHMDHHLAREIQAHREWLQPWTSQQRAPQLVRADVAAKLLVSRYLDGELVQGSEHEWRPETYVQAGALLAQLHRQGPYEDPDFEACQKKKALRWLEGPHRIAPELTAQLQVEVLSWPTPTVQLAFLEGYGCDPRDAEAWHRNAVREAIGTAVWAYQVGDTTFEQQGHWMIAEAMASG